MLSPALKAVKTAPRPLGVVDIVLLVIAVMPLLALCKAALWLSGDRTPLVDYLEPKDD